MVKNKKRQALPFPLRCGLCDVPIAEGKVDEHMASIEHNRKVNDAHLMGKLRQDNVDRMLQGGGG